MAWLSVILRVQDMYKHEVSSCELSDGGCYVGSVTFGERCVDDF